LSVEGGTVEIDKCQLICTSCQHPMTVPCGSARPQVCPNCKSKDIDCLKRIGKDQTIKKCWRD
jgi:Zn finger protein HypA/HybF involved in hydrogenase expression